MPRRHLQIGREQPSKMREEAEDQYEDLDKAVRELGSLWVLRAINNALAKNARQNVYQKAVRRKLKEG
jgi:hypothetical protein